MNGEPIPVADRGLTENVELAILPNAERAIHAFNEYLQLIPHHSTCKPALNLHIFNYINESKDIGDGDITKELETLRPLISDELEYSGNHHFPSIGTEVEVSKDFFSFDDKKNELMIHSLIKMGIDVIKETAEKHPTEFILPPTSSSQSQGKMILELQKSGLIPADMRFASLHINLGISEDDYGNLDDETIAAISDLITYAFVPSERVRNRTKSQYSHLVGKERRIFADNFLSIKPDAPGEIERIEFRTPRVIGPRTYQLLHFTQHLGALFYRDTLIPLREEFKRESAELLKKYGLSPDLPASDQTRAADAIKHAEDIKILDSADPSPNLIDEARFLMERYVEQIINLNRQVQE